MDTTKPPPPTAVPPKPKPTKKLKKITPQKKPKPQPTQPKQLSPISKKDKEENPKQKLYDLYENFKNYDHKRADAEIKMAEQKQLEVLRDMLVKGFAVKNLQSLHRTLLQTTDKKNVPGRINDRGDGLKFGLSEKTVATTKKTNLKQGNNALKKAKPLKKSSVKKN